MPRQNKKPLCPIGIDCIVEFGQCPNYHYCRNHTYSWAIPYRYENNVLTVKDFGYRYRWRKEATGISHQLPPQCTLPSGSYYSIDEGEEQETRKQMLEEWKNEGWSAAIDLPQEKDLEYFLEKENNCLTVKFPKFFMTKNWVEHFKSQGFDEAVKLPYHYNFEDKSLIVNYPKKDAKTLGWETAENIWLDF